MHRVCAVRLCIPVDKMSHRVLSVSTRVDAFETWINDFITGSTSTPTGVCGDATCDLGESCDGRGSTDACTADCDGLLTGWPLGRFCEIGPYCLGPGCP